jgi:heme exporter protein D
MEQSDSFFYMGGYGFYVWSSYGITLMVLVLNYIMPRIREKKLINRLIQISKMKTRETDEP